MRIQSPPYRPVPLVFLVAIAAAAAAPAFAAGKAADIAVVPGEWWENTTEMSMAGMEGMHMPATTSKFCRPKSAAWDEPPPMNRQSDCKMTDHQASPGHMTWKMVCTQPKATASGEMSWSGPDAYSGSMTMTMDQGTMNMKLSGRRVGGDCDAEAPRRQIAQTMEKAQAMQDQSCKDAAKSFNFDLFTMPQSPCKDPADKADMCRRAATLEGYRTLAGDVRRNCSQEGPSDSVKKALAFCDTSDDALRKPLCEQVKKSEEDLAFLGACCVDAATELAQRECAGRKYTELAGTGSKYTNFCAQFASTLLGTAPAAGQPAPDQTGRKKKGILKGLFGK